MGKKKVIEFKTYSCRMNCIYIYCENTSVVYFKRKKTCLKKKNYVQRIQIENEYVDTRVLMALDTIGR